jgi:lysophospholipase L1-like esterase
VGVANRLVPQALSMNLGVNGYTSYQGCKALLKYGALIDPDIIFVSFNFNDRRFVLQPELADGDTAFQQLYSSSLVRDPTEANPAAPRMIGDMFTTDVRLDKVRPRVDVRGYRENLTKMVQWAKQHGSAVAFILLGDNPDQTSTLREGVKHLSEKNYAAAIKSLTEAKDDSDDVWFSALARLYLSEAFRATGRHDAAEQVLSMKDALAGLTGGYPIVLDSDYHRIMKEVADEHGALLVDAASELNKDTSVYWDFCHFDGRGHATVGRLVAGVIETARKRRAQ